MNINRKTIHHNQRRGGIYRRDTANLNICPRSRVSIRLYIDSRHSPLQTLQHIAVTVLCNHIRGHDGDRTGKIGTPLFHISGDHQLLHSVGVPAQLHIDEISALDGNLLLTYPTAEKISTPSSTSVKSSYSPSRFVAVPILLFSRITVTPGSASPVLASVTRPVIDCCCCSERWRGFSCLGRMITYPFPGE